MQTAMMKAAKQVLKHERKLAKDTAKEAQVRKQAAKEAQVRKHEAKQAAKQAAKEAQVLKHEAKQAQVQKKAMAQKIITALRKIRFASNHKKAPSTRWQVRCCRASLYARFALRGLSAASLSVP